MKEVMIFRIMEFFATLFLYLGLFNFLLIKFVIFLAKESFLKDSRLLSFDTFHGIPL